MSARARAAAVAADPPIPALSTPRHLTPLVAVLAVSVLVPLVLVSAGRAQLAPSHRTLGPAEVERLGLGVEVARRQEGRQLLVSISSRSARGEAEPRLLAAAPDGGPVALADRLGVGPAELLITRPDGGLTITAMDGLLGAAFAPDGSWLAAVDGTGTLWRADPGDGATAMLAEGPFAGAVEHAPDGRLLLLLLSSVEAPTSSLPVLLDPATGTLEPVAGVAGEGLVYRARAVPGGIGLVVHRPDGSKELRRANAPDVLVTVPPTAGTIDFAPDLSAVAYRSGDDEITLLHPLGAAGRTVAGGGQPRFSPDGTRLLVELGGTTVTLEVASGRVTPVGGQAVWAACEGECRP